jgi:hypothetical protein
MASIRGRLVYEDDTIALYFDMDFKGIARYALESRELGRNLDDLARATKSYAESISPYDDRVGDDRDRVEPHYRNSWSTTEYIERRIGEGPHGKLARQAQLVTNNSQHAVLVEFGGGTGNNPYGHRIFPRLFEFLESRVA